VTAHVECTRAFASLVVILEMPLGVTECTFIGYLSTGGTTAARPGLVEVTGGVALSSAVRRLLVWLHNPMAIQLGWLARAL
jgi:hypothetical protein